MILWGNISHYSVFMVLQLLASYGKSGMLELQDEEEKAVIYMRDDPIDAVSVPRSDHLLGTRLVKAGFISDKNLRQIMLSAAQRDDSEFLGVTLINSGMVDKKAIIQVLKNRHLRIRSSFPTGCREYSSLWYHTKQFFSQYLRG